MKVGDLLWVQEEGARMVLSPVIRKEAVTEVGRYNPYLAAGDIFVNGVLASCHSGWFLEEYTQSHTAVAIYEALFAPLALLHALHPGWFKRFHKKLANMRKPLDKLGALEIAETAVATIRGWCCMVS